MNTLKTSTHTVRFALAMTMVLFSINDPCFAQKPISSDEDASGASVEDRKVGQATRVAIGKVLAKEAAKTVVENIPVVGPIYSKVSNAIEVAKELSQEVEKANPQAKPQTPPQAKPQAPTKKSKPKSTKTSPIRPEPGERYRFRQPPARENRTDVPNRERLERIRHTA